MYIVNRKSATFSCSREKKIKKKIKLCISISNNVEGANFFAPHSLGLANFLSSLSEIFTL